MFASEMSRDPFPVCRCGEFEPLVAENAVRVCVGGGRELILRPETGKEGGTRILVGLRKMIESLCL
jgi:hypothetical protein